MKNNFVNKQKYDNIRLYSPDNLLMCYISQRKSDWYTSRNAAIQLDESSIKLLFEPKALGHYGTPYLVEMATRCVVCGDSEIAHLTKHHIIPDSFRKHFPPKWKDSRYYDVCFLCWDCHSKYEKEAWKFANKLLNSIGGYQLLKDYQKMKKYTVTLMHYVDQISSEKCELMENWLKDYYDVEDCSDCVLEELYRLPAPNPYKILADQITDYEEFGRMWKQHFLATMKPQFLPEFWEQELSEIQENQGTNSPF